VQGRGPRACHLRGPVVVRGAGPCSSAPAQGGEGVNFHAKWESRGSGSTMSAVGRQVGGQPRPAGPPARGAARGLTGVEVRAEGEAGVEEGRRHGQRQQRGGHPRAGAALRTPAAPASPSGRRRCGARGPRAQRPRPPAPSHRRSAGTGGGGDRRGASARRRGAAGLRLVQSENTRERARGGTEAGGWGGWGEGWRPGATEAGRGQ
jgi:hypothetical protein